MERLQAVRSLLGVVDKDVGKPSGVVNTVNGAGRSAVIGRVLIEFLNVTSREEVRNEGYRPQPALQRPPRLWYIRYRGNSWWTIERSNRIDGTPKMSEPEAQERGQTMGSLLLGGCF